MDWYDFFCKKNHTSPSIHSFTDKKTQHFLFIQKVRMELLYVLLIGAVSGWFAGLLIKGQEYGLLWNIILGILGSFIGGWLLDKLGMHPNFGSRTLNLIVTSVVGAALVLFLAGWLNGSRHGRSSRRR